MMLSRHGPSPASVSSRSIRRATSSLAARVLRDRSADRVEMETWSAPGTRSTASRQMLSSTVWESAPE